ncbi:MAG: hypothetical protein ACREJ6_07955 [Candidatus Methylomirabilis sp.]
MKSTYARLAARVAATIAGTLLTLISYVSFANEGLDHADLPWPPVSRGIENVIVHSKPHQETKQQEDLDNQVQRLARRAKLHPKVEQALGDRFAHIGVVDEKNNDRFKNKRRLVFFSYAKNATVEATMEGDKVLEVKTTPADQYQPEITDEETAEATEIAREYFIRKGFERVRGLEGFGILAYKPTGNGFYSGRVIYVSFHENSDSPPELAAWVDLTKQKVIKMRREPR